MRPSRDDINMQIANIVATRATCARRAVGAVVLDHDGYIIGTGYNGVAKGLEHCTLGEPCDGACHPSGTNIDLCEATHAEQNVLLHCSDVRKAHTIYVTTSPCMSCLKLLLSTNIQRVVYQNSYPGSDKCKELWERMGRVWDHYKC